MTPLYDVTLRRPDQGASHLAVVKAVRAPGLASNWFDGAQELMMPDRDAVRSALPHTLLPAFDRQANSSFWFTNDSLHASMTLYGSRGKTLATIHCDGYERE